MANEDRPISVRFGAELKAKLDERADAMGIARSDAIREAVAAFVDRTDLAPAGDEARLRINTATAAAAIALGADAVGPLKGLASYLYRRGYAALAALLWSAAARAMMVEAAEPSDQLRREVSNELAHSAAVVNAGSAQKIAAEEPGRRKIAEALWREAFRLDPSNLVAANRLGQVLYFEAQGGDDAEAFKEAADLLRKPSRLDNHALLFLGMSLLNHAVLTGGNRDDARDKLREALETWAFTQRDGTEMGPWLKQVEEVRALGESKLADELIDFARLNTAWPLPD